MKIVSNMIKRPNAIRVIKCQKYVMVDARTELLQQTEKEKEKIKNEKKWKKTCHKN